MGFGNYKGKKYHQKSVYKSSHNPVPPRHIRHKFQKLAHKGRNYPIQTAVWTQTEKGKGKRTAVTTGGGAALGAIIGGIAGGGKGAAIGAGVGGGAGFAGGALTGNKQIEVPAESALTFSLSSSLTIEQK